MQAANRNFLTFHVNVSGIDEDVKLKKTKLDRAIEKSITTQKSVDFEFEERN